MTFLFDLLLVSIGAIIISCFAYGLNKFATGIDDSEDEEKEETGVTGETGKVTIRGALIMGTTSLKSFFLEDGCTDTFIKVYTLKVLGHDLGRIVRALEATLQHFVDRDREFVEDCRLKIISFLEDLVPLVNLINRELEILAPSFEMLNAATELHQNLEKLTELAEENAKELDKIWEEDLE
ncbi:hypothetical protein ACFL35_19795 [Candidatus Riflebacteria bacterium]